MNINWYPGHMTASKRMMEQNIALVDVVIELLDARIPQSSRNPDIDVMAKAKKRIIILNKADLADDAVTRDWARFYREKGFVVIMSDCMSGAGVGDIAVSARTLMKEKIERQMSRGRLFVPVRAMIAGIPNVGKSTLINKCVGRAITKTADRPGVTRNKQWIKIKKDFELLDTPGILWPKLGDVDVGIRLALTGAVKDDVVDIFTLSQKLVELLGGYYPNAIPGRYGIDCAGDAPPAVLEKIAVARGFLQKGGVADVERAAIILVDEFRAGKLGRISLERPV